jgi:hypothetical protein
MRWSLAIMRGGSGMKHMIGWVFLYLSFISLRGHAISYVTCVSRIRIVPRLSVSCGVSRVQGIVGLMMGTLSIRRNL